MTTGAPPACASVEVKPAEQGLALGLVDVQFRATKCELLGTREIIVVNCLLELTRDDGIMVRRIGRNLLEQRDCFRLKAVASQ